MTDNSGKSRGFGFVCFTSPNVASTALKEMRGKLLKGKPLYVSLAQRKELRQAQLNQHFNKMMTGSTNMYSAANTPMYYNNNNSMYDNPQAPSPFRRNNFTPRSQNNNYNQQPHMFNNNNYNNSGGSSQPRRLRGNGRNRSMYGNGRPR